MDFIKRYWIILLALSVYFYIGSNFLQYYKYQINSDGASYINIALKYADGNLKDAVNAYWSPLFSLLMVPFIKFKIAPLVSAKLLSMFIGSFTLLACFILLKRFKVTAGLQLFILISLIPTTLWFAYATTTPDLLVATNVLFYLSMVFDEKIKKNILFAVLTGITGGLCYLSKQFAGYYFISHFLFFSGLYFFSEKKISNKKAILINTFIVLAIFTVIAFTWITIISNKYSKFTTGTSSTFNRALIGPYSKGVPLFNKGLIKPPNSTAVSAWEDPSYFLNYYPEEFVDWSPLSSLFLFKYQWGIIMGNIVPTFFEIQKENFLLILSIIICVLFFVKPINKKGINDSPFQLLTSVGIYLLGYQTTFIQHRYLFPVFFLLYISIGFILTYLFKNVFFTASRKAVLLVILFISMTYWNWTNLINGKYLNKQTFDFGQKLINVYKIKPDSKFSSNTNWERTELFAFQSKTQFYGQTTNINESTILNDLKKHKIDYYFVWGDYVNPDIKLTQNFLNKFKEITSSNEGELKIYYLK